MLFDEADDDALEFSAVEEVFLESTSSSEFDAGR